ncbi:type I DNA topoisomerase [Stratiformator vulcanicus]|uniref:DNA topoisomerase 1 n=1 Tax=Stratiformator vulcanicus TaxID=2527980 RepID=A0A517R3S6_9PLAN|nr:type I DNA topoisomerase [Stratiformator vulcanicus]QDT38516.1 DNA topoisomerase 1 [Stratiformator vulcanicus]
MVAKAKKTLVIVESPAKAKKIQSFLGPGYEVLASYGHVRDLPSKAAEIPEKFKKEAWSNLGVNVEQDYEPLYVIPKDKKDRVKQLRDSLKNADELLIATDEDREGESIGWHLIELLKPKVPVRRMVFAEITKDAIQRAINDTRELDENLVAAQETRRVLDRLYGYTLSPLLWKKIARGLSAGRVQSVAVRMLVERELERAAFRSGSYWDLAANLKSGESTPFDAALQTVGGRKIASGKDFDETTGQLKTDANVLLLDEAAATELRERIEKSDWSVAEVETRDQKRNPYPPFTTSTLQQEANRKLSLSARQTMQIAQKLYEEGHITYMRTDSVSLSNEAVSAIRRTIDKRYGHDYLSPQTRTFSGKSKNAQEAHEAIRPAGTAMQTAKELGLSGGQAKLYDLVWKRSVACQMAEARLKFQTVTIKADDAEFRATGRHVEFPGFFRAYVEGSDDPEAALDDTESALPPLSQGDQLNVEELKALPHETKPPARFTEASLVRRLEAEGIGRPSTYASIIGTVQDRGYVEKQGSQLVPTFTAVAVNRLLQQHFPDLVDYSFTADMEQKLDDISNGDKNRLPYLNRFYSGPSGIDQQVKSKEEGIDPRTACTLKLDNLDPDVRIGRYGPFFEVQSDGERVTASIPNHIAPADLTEEMAEKLIREKKEGPKSLGAHPEEGLPIYIKNGPYGPYVQLGDITEETPKPKRSGIPKSINPEEVDLETAIKLLGLPRRLGHHPDTGKVVNVGIGPYGPYVLHDRKYGSFDKKTHTFEYDGESYNIFNVTLDAACEMLRQSKSRGPAKPLRELGEHPEDKKPVGIFEGRYGSYVKHGRTNATLPKDRDIKEVTLEEAVTMLNEKAAKKGTKKKGAKKKATKKKAAKKKSAKKKT